jgi:tRNA-dihydrouridine synthase B
MAGFTDAAMRGVCRRFGAGLTFTEVASADGLARHSTRTLHLLETAEGEHPVAAHIYGGDPDIMARAAEVVRKLDRFDLLDINAGCPVPKLMAKGYGAALLRDPARVEAIVRRVREAVAPMPVTLKTRIGLTPADQNQALDMIRAAEQGGVAMVSVHARFAVHRHAGDADWAGLARVREAVRIPVLGNGGVRGPEDARRLLETTGVDGAMIGRAAIGDPWVFQRVRDGLAGLPPAPPPSDAERRDVALDHLDRLIALMAAARWRGRRRHKHMPEETAVLHFRGHFGPYLRGCPRWPRIRRRLNELHFREDMLAALDEAFGAEPPRPDAADP